MRQNEKDESTKRVPVHSLVFVCLVYICPSCSPSVKSSLFIRLHHFVPSVFNPGLIHASAGHREGLWHSKGNVTAVISETDTSPPTDTGRGSSLSARGEQRDASQ